MPWSMLLTMLLLQIPTGVYWPGEATYNTDPQRDQKLQADFAKLRRSNVNAIWITHLTSAETARFAGLCAPHGIRVIAAVADLDIHGPAQAWKQVPAYWEPTIPAVLADYRAANGPQPLAWGLGDEPTESDVYRDYVAAWKATGEPTTATVTRGHIEPFAGVGLTTLTHNAYPFFAPAGGGYGDGPLFGWQRSCEANVKASGKARSYAIYQTFAKPDVWVTPTPAQVRWQIHSAIALGVDGVFAFVWSPEPGPEQLTTLQQLPAQFAAMGDAYGKVKLWSRTLERARAFTPATVTESGALVATGIDERGRSFLLTVARPDVATVFTIGTQARWARGVAGGRFVVARRRVLQVVLGAGDGELWELR